MFYFLSELMLVCVPVTAVAGLYCLFCSKGKYHRYLVWAAAVFLGSMGVWCGGGVLLRQFGLAWRSAPSLILIGAVLISGWAGTVFTMICILKMQQPETNRYFRWAAKALVAFAAGVILFTTLWASPILLIFGFGDAERVVEYQGQTLLEVNDGFMDPHYSYYAYHGPIVRGAERVWDGPAPIWGDFD